MSVGSNFKALVDDSATTYGDVRAFLEGLSPEERREAIEAAGGKQRQARLFALAAAGEAISLEDLIPAEAKGPLETVIFHGKNSLPAFSHFQKRFCRDAAGDALIGYNHQALAFVTGPGYFVVRPARDDEQELGGVAIDYTREPDTTPPGWPEVKPNSRGVSRLVYADMVDFLRPLADDVFIGRAQRGGKLTDNYFLLVREPLH